MMIQSLRDYAHAQSDESFHELNHTQEVIRDCVALELIFEIPIVTI